MHTPIERLEISTQAMERLLDDHKNIGGVRTLTRKRIGILKAAIKKNGQTISVMKGEV
jgi:hypothetical protein